VVGEIAARSPVRGHRLESPSEHVSGTLKAMAIASPLTNGGPILGARSTPGQIGADLQAAGGRITA